jgi:hypothetical protein
MAAEVTGAEAATAQAPGGAANTAAVASVVASAAAADPEKAALLTLLRTEFSRVYLTAVFVDQGPHLKVTLPCLLARPRFLTGEFSPTHSTLIALTPSTCAAECMQMQCERCARRCFFCW